MSVSVGSPSLACLRRACFPLLTVVAIYLAGCGSPESASKPVTVFAAASMTDVLAEIAKAWKADGGADVRFSLGATSKLVPQVIEGAPADALVSADEAWMDKLEAAGKVEAGSRAVIARNELVFMVPAGSLGAPASASDLPRSLQKIALAGENVPAGKYAKSALEKAHVWDAVLPRVVRAEDVRMALKWVSGGDAQGGIVYLTDAKADPRVRVAFAFPSDSHAPIVYLAAVVKGAARAANAARFLAFCLSGKARPIFAKFGFLPPSP